MRCHRCQGRPAVAGDDPPDACLAVEHTDLTHAGETGNTLHNAATAGIHAQPHAQVPLALDLLDGSG